MRGSWIYGGMIWIYLDDRELCWLELVDSTSIILHHHSIFTRSSTKQRLACSNGWWLEISSHKMHGLFGDKRGSYFRNHGWIKYPLHPESQQRHTCSMSWICLEFHQLCDSLGEVTCDRTTGFIWPWHIQQNGNALPIKIAGYWDVLVRSY